MFAGPAIVDAVRFFPAPGTPSISDQVGFRSGDKGTQTSRTIMLSELIGLFAAVSPQGSRSDYAEAIIGRNCLGKPTASTRRLTNQRLGELYALDPTVRIFRIMRRLWNLDANPRLLALLASLARDPLLLATAPAVISLSEGFELQRSQMREALRQAVGNRLNDSILDKVIRNAASSWAQSGHLVGRTFKIRKLVLATPASAAFALYLGHALGFRSQELLKSGWMMVLDCSPTLARELALEAKRQGLIDLRMSGDVLELQFERLDPWYRRR